MEVREPSARYLTPAPHKQTELGVLPLDWQVTRLSEIANVTSGKRLPLGHSLVASETPYPYIRVSDMRHGTVDSAAIQFVPVDVFPKIQQYRIFSTDLYISVAGTLGLVGQIPSALDGANLTENANRISGIRGSKLYLYQVLASPLVQSVIESERTVGAQPKLALGRIRNFNIPLPPTSEEQVAIGSALTDADALIDSLEQLLTKKRQIKQGAMQELLTGQRRLIHAADWHELRLGDVASLKARIGWQGLTTAEYRERGNHLLVTGTEFFGGRIRWDACHYVDQDRYDQDKNIQLLPGDVLVTKDGTIGKAALVDTLPMPATLNSGVFVIRPRNRAFHPGFFYYLLASTGFSSFLSQLSAGSTINHLYQKDFVHFKFHAPRDIEEQRAVFEVLRAIDLEIDTIDSRLTKARALKQAMAQALLTGRIRLVPEGAV